MTAAVLAPPRYISPAKAAQHGLSLAWRGILKIRKNPEQLIDVTIQPILFLVMFVYLFGGAISGSTGAYLQTLTPGLMVQNTIMASLSAGVALNTDVSKGVFDRFRSMPIARSAPLVGAVLADIVRYLVAIVVLLAMAMIMGFRVHTNPLAAIGGAALMVVAGLCFCWIAVFVGMLVQNPGSVQGIMIAFIFPLTFGSNVFVPSGTMPGWLHAWSDISPVSLLADTMRGLLVGGDVGGPLLGALAWMAGVVVVFFPLAMRAYRRRVG
ncbi:ABC transporter permease [Amycolatopsis acidiphila]|uniref:Transport permease protein n=1 Tax=Amycolatopsis acidiphila TaxID=715473 RepID=A0A557ZS83_9PSEU|nr:ABC transporter permease [Amycolatopsis acidiphila]TVT14886.1 ABC transporter permease [Amycolatopsis acidiphila]UIJ59433.1 ABC transporter permease [Amycolatopsis acidiphila]GHG94450.1 transport permease protein [Amycolatopsis acidiphila]